MIYEMTYRVRRYNTCLKILNAATPKMLRRFLDNPDWSVQARLAIEDVYVSEYGKQGMLIETTLEESLAEIEKIRTTELQIPVSRASHFIENLIPILFKHWSRQDGMSMANLDAEIAADELFDDIKRHPERYRNYSFSQFARKKEKARQKDLVFC